MFTLVKAELVLQSLLTCTVPSFNPQLYCFIKRMIMIHFFHKPCKHQIIMSGGPESGVIMATFFFSIVMIFLKTLSTKLCSKDKLGKVKN